MRSSEVYVGSDWLLAHRANRTRARITRANRESEPDLNNISVFQAIEEQLGLKLEAHKEPVEVLVIDHVEKPQIN
jgi:uncharacterized protein (TIGR03435 family)